MWFSVGLGTKEAENVFLTHRWESGYRCAGGGGLDPMACVRNSVFALPSATA